MPNHKITRATPAIAGLLLIAIMAVNAVAQPRSEPLFESLDPTYQRIKVINVAATDTLYLENNIKVRLIGLKAPLAPEKEKVQYDQFGFIREDERRPFNTLEEQALNFAKDLLEGKLVRLEFDSQKRDENHALLAYVFLLEDNTFVNEKILQQGFASLRLGAPNLKYADVLRAAYLEANREKRGLQGQ